MGLQELFSAAHNTSSAWVLVYQGYKIFFAGDDKTVFPVDKLCLGSLDPFCIDDESTALIHGFQERVLRAATVVLNDAHIYHIFCICKDIIEFLETLFKGSLVVLLEAQII